MNLCKAIDCPYFNPASKGYGCQKYHIPHCHLISPLNHAYLRLKFSVYEQIELNQYTISLNTENQQAINFLKQANNDYLAQDEKYKNDLAFAKRIGLPKIYE
jgi:hypothetical protein